MSISRPFDILIYGATGVAGKHVVKHFLNNHPMIKMAIGGRNKTKLEQLMNELNNSDNSNNKINPKQILVASSDNENDLHHILSQTKVVLACAGPYRQCGKYIVEAAIKAQTDYLDLCGEPQFFDDMFVEYDSMAKERNVLVVSACAFDCVPSEMCFQLASKELLKKYSGTSAAVTNVEIVHTFSGIKKANDTTFHAAVDGFHAAYTGELKSSRQKVKEAFPLLQSSMIKDGNTRSSEWKRFISKPGTSPLYHEDTNTHILKFMGADTSCILASDRYLRLRCCENGDAVEEQKQQEQQPPPFPFLSVAFGIAEKSHAYKFLTYGAIFSTLAKWSWGCKLLHSNPDFFTNGFFTSGGPTEDDMKDAKFATYGTAYGLTKDQCVKVKFSGGEPGYIATSAMMSALALTVLNHKDALKFKGGVCTPGSAFSDCDIVFDMLKQEGLDIEVIPTDGNDLAVESGS